MCPQSKNLASGSEPNLLLLIFSQGPNLVHSACELIILLNRENIQLKCILNYENTTFSVSDSDWGLQAALKENQTKPINYRGAGVDVTVKLGGWLVVTERTYFCSGSHRKFQSDHHCRSEVGR